MPRCSPSLLPYFRAGCRRPRCTSGRSSPAATSSTTSSSWVPFLPPRVCLIPTHPLTPSPSLPTAQALIDVAATLVFFSLFEPLWGPIKPLVSSPRPTLSPPLAPPSRPLLMRRFPLQELIAVTNLAAVFLTSCTYIVLYAITGNIANLCVMCDPHVIHPLLRVLLLVSAFALLSLSIVFFFSDSFLSFLFRRSSAVFFPFTLDPHSLPFHTVSSTLYPSPSHPFVSFTLFTLNPHPLPFHTLSSTLYSSPAHPFLSFTLSTLNPHPSPFHTSSSTLYPSPAHPFLSFTLSTLNSHPSPYHTSSSTLYPSPFPSLLTFTPSTLNPHPSPFHP